MTAVKIVLHNDEHDELELGPFSQGVVMETFNRDGRQVIKDVASSRLVAFYRFESYGWSERNGEKSYSKVFIHAAPA